MSLLKRPLAPILPGPKKVQRHLAMSQHVCWKRGLTSNLCTVNDQNFGYNTHAATFTDNSFALFLCLQGDWVKHCIVIIHSLSSCSSSTNKSLLISGKVADYSLLFSNDKNDKTFDILSPYT